MKKGKIFTNCLFSVCMLIAMISLASCSADSDSTSSIDNSIIENASNQENTSFSVVLKAYSDNKDITVKGDVDQTTLFVFDQQGDFYKQINVDRTYLLQAKPIEITCPESKQITVVAWAGISGENETISAMNQANIISDLQVSLKQNNGVAASLPGDLFYGQVTLKSNTSTKSSTETLKIERKVSSISLVTKGIIKVLDSKEGNFYYKVKKTKSSFNHNGELTGEDIEYIIPATLNEKGNVVADKTTILPASNITIELYKDDNMILSSENVKNLEKVSVNEGEQSEMTFDLSKNSGNIVVTDWGTVIQHVTIG
ncbi:MULTISPECIES: FimB/Mfa2 family fimbrial subunit [Parabacteroides]|uniref:FimB/Mfa2 family fimbrial subunit n=1 Tax=Parabacteroides leei TaxID=2939491 RepID=UPI00189BB6B7|nr:MULTISPECIES: FimB/Mfa2 family fimbrial subunit [Parabacteroides]MCL3850511.1 FimB/Mfa2 family fimbrial subunit [Parabacteroides leei]